MEDVFISSDKNMCNEFLSVYTWDYEIYSLICEKALNMYINFRNFFRH